MARIVFGAPGLDRFHLHERLRRELCQRGHEVLVWATEPAAATAYAQHGFAVARLRLRAAEPMQAPLAEFAAREAARRGAPPWHRRHRAVRRRVQDRLARLLPAVLQAAEAAPPDLLLLHQRRTADAALLQFTAQALGSRVLWTGDGLLPHTQQLDAGGLDGDAAACRRSAGDYRDRRAEPEFLAACLTHVLGGAAPHGLTRAAVGPPPLRARLADLWPAYRAAGLPGLAAALGGWRAAARLPAADGGPAAAALPTAPFVAVLLQDPAAERVRLDAPHAPRPRELLAAARGAAQRLDPTLHVVAVLPPDGLPAAELADLRGAARCHVLPAAAAGPAAAAAAATLTVNHPLATAALLAGTPVVHCGAARFALPGVTTLAPTAAFDTALAAAVAAPPGTLRERFLSWTLGHDHLWCSATEPDHNGLQGFVLAIEQRLGERRPRGALLRHRAGPPWPLGAPGR